LVDGEATVNAVFTAVRRPNVTSEICAVNGDFAGDGGVGFLGRKRFAQLM
jgi:hypothetical protein